MSAFEQGWALQVILWFQSWRTPLVADIALVFNFLGTENFLLPLLAFVYWCVDAAFGRRLTILFVINAWLNTWIKDLFNRPRPFQVSDQVHKLVDEPSPGIPSAHAQNTALIAGTFADKIKRSWVTALLVVYALLMAVSRMVAGVHFPEDVTAGLVIGLIAVLLYLWLEPRASAWLNTQGLWTQIGLAVGLGVIMLVIDPLVVRTESLDDLNNALSAGAAMMGAGIGFALETRYVRFSEKGEWWKLVLRFALGLGILFGVRLGLGAVFEPLQPVWLWRVIRYTCIGLSVSWFAPWLFVKLRLAGRMAN